MFMLIDKCVHCANYNIKLPQIVGSNGVENGVRRRERNEPGNDASQRRWAMVSEMTIDLGDEMNDAPPPSYEECMKIANFNQETQLSG